VSKIKYVVAVPGRPDPICIEAGGMVMLGDGVAFQVEGKNVAYLPNVVLVAQSDALADFPEDLADFVAAPRACSRPAYLVPPPPPPMRSIKAKPAKFKVNPSPRWPFAAGLALGALVGVLGMLAFAIV